MGETPVHDLPVSHGSSADSEPAFLVVGGDSLIGSALGTRLERAGKRVVSTTRRREAPRNRVFLDLAGDVDQWQLPEPVSVAIICAGVTKIEDCGHDPVSTSHINVDSIRKLIGKLADAEAFIVFLSTNQVFDGSVPQRAADDTLSPQTEYGKQKAEIERHLACHTGNAAVVRLTKVLGTHSPLLRRWVDALRDGEAVHPFRDMVISPVPLSFVATVLESLCENRRAGVFQVSSEAEVTYAEVAYYLADKMRVSQDLVQPIEATDAGILSGAVPRHTSLDTARLRAELGLKPPDVWATIDYAVSELISD